MTAPSVSPSIWTWLIGARMSCQNSVGVVAGSCVRVTSASLYVRPPEYPPPAPVYPVLQPQHEPRLAWLRSGRCLSPSRPAGPVSGSGSLFTWTYATRTRGNWLPRQTCYSLGAGPLAHRAQPGSYNHYCVTNGQTRCPADCHSDMSVVRKPPTCLSQSACRSVLLISRVSAPGAAARTRRARSLTINNQPRTPTTPRHRLSCTQRRS